MSGPDVLFLCLVGLAALRGFWRGFFREAFGLLALIGGLAAAVWFTPSGEAFIRNSFRLPPPIPAGVAFVGTFVVVHTLLNALGAFAAWLRGASAHRWLDGLGGAVVGAGKGGVLLAFILLFFHLFPVLPKIDARLDQSVVAQHLMAVAVRAVRAGWAGDASPDAGRSS